jgi:Na+/H+ antiporter NhaD/arsenite permease-like protein
MNVPLVSLTALIVAIVVSCTTKINAGFLSIAFAWLIGSYLAGMNVNQIAAGFPSQLFLTLVGVTLLFTQAQANGTLDRVAHRAVKGCRGNVGVMPVMFFLLALGLASIGPGNIASAALMAPMAMTVASRVGIPAFLMAIMVGNGANAGALSPLAPTGIIVKSIMEKVGLGGYALQTYANNVAAHTLVAVCGYLLFGGWKLFGKRHMGAIRLDDGLGLGGTDDYRFETKHRVTLAVIAALLLGVIAFELPVGLAAFVGAVFLTMFGMADEIDAVRRMPWRVIMMVTGVTVLIAIVEKTGGMELFTSVLASLATKQTVTAVIAFFTGLISIYSSTSGVVLPALLPTVPGLASQLGADPLSIASSMNVGGHLVDVSPLSTIGALCLASAPLVEEHRRLFNQLMAWGLSMAVVGAIACWVLFRP